MLARFLTSLAISAMSIAATFTMLVFVTVFWFAIMLRFAIVFTVWTMVTFCLVIAVRLVSLMERQGLRNHRRPIPSRQLRTPVISIRSFAGSGIGRHNQPRMM